LCSPTFQLHCSNSDDAFAHPEKILWRIPQVGSDMLADMSDTDLELLARYTRRHAEDAFAEIVRRHLGLVYSAALRQVRSPQLAEEVAQSAFADLARQAARLKPDTILTAWLYQVTRRTAIDVIRREASRQSREQIASEMNAMNATTADWAHLEPLLDEAMHALDDPDRAAVLLRYFENKSLREVGQALGASENAVQKRLTRAVEHLREYFAKHGATTSAGGLVAVISANAVQAAPIGLATAISTAASLAGAAFTATTATATKAIAMTTLQKAIVGAAFVATVAVGIYESRRASNLKSQVETLQQQHVKKVHQLENTLEDTTRQLIALRKENDRLNRNMGELLKLRGEVTQLRSDAAVIRQAREANVPERDQQVFALPTLSKDFPLMMVNAVVPWNQVMVAGGWKRSSGRRAVLFSVPRQMNPEDKTQMTITGHILEFPEDAAATLGLEQFITEAPEIRPSGMLTTDRYEAVLKKAESTEGVVAINLGSVTTTNGRQTQLQSVELKRTEPGERMEGPIVDLIPTVSNDGQSVRLKVLVQFPPAEPENK
jgi:RNA polymerase sigma factor (sigma-70 family)